MTNKTKSQIQDRYFGEIVQLKNGKFKFVFVEKLVKINQYKKKWKRNINTRNFSREVNREGLVIK